MARGSALECAAVLDLLHARGAVAESVYRDARTLLVRIVQMLTRLIDRQRQPPRPVTDGRGGPQARA